MKLRDLIPAVAIAFAIAIVCVTRFQDRPCADDNPSACQIDLLQGDLADKWSVFGGLAPTEVHFTRNEAGYIEVSRNTQSPSKSRSGVSYTAGLFRPGWYEFTADFRAETNGGKAVGVQVEVRSGRWRYITNSGRRSRKRWQHVEVFFRPADADPSAEVLCHLWGPKSDHAVSATFKTMRIVKVDGLPPERKLRFDLQKQEQARLADDRPTRQGGVRRLGIAVLLLAAIVGICWWSAE